MFRTRIAKGLGIGALAGSIAIATPIIAKWEGLKTDPYRDMVGVWTVCYGETRVPMRRYTKEECDALLGEGVSEFALALKETVGRDMPDTVHAAFTSLTYNVGKRRLDGTTTLRLLREGRWQEACDRLLLWNKAGGKVVRGLTNRRKEERELCLSGI